MHPSFKLCTVIHFSLHYYNILIYKNIILIILHDYARIIFFSILQKKRIKTMADDSGSCFNETSMHVIICYFKIQGSQSTH